MLLHPTKLSTTKFLWCKEERMFVAEMSDLQIVFNPVWDDAVDVGLTLISQWSGMEIVFVMIHEQIIDGDVIYWDLEPATPIFKRMAPKIFIRIFND